jgi:DNA-binding MarR family transcriptional regulator
MRKQPPSDIPHVEGSEAMSRILWTIPSLYHRLTAIGELIYSRHGLTSGKRSLLNDLAEKGPHSLAEMVRARPPVTRQYIQRLVAELRNAGMVEFGENPNDLRSKIVRLTAQGRRVIEALEPVEQRLAKLLAAGHSQAELDAAMRTLARVAHRLKDEGLRGALGEN